MHKYLPCIAASALLIFASGLPEQKEDKSVADAKGAGQCAHLFLGALARLEVKPGLLLLLGHHVHFLEPLLALVTLLQLLLFRLSLVVVRRLDLKPLERPTLATVRQLTISYRRTSSTALISGRQDRHWAGGNQKQARYNEPQQGVHMNIAALLWMFLHGMQTWPGRKHREACLLWCSNYIQRTP